LVVAAVAEMEQTVQAVAQLLQMELLILAAVAAVLDKFPRTRHRKVAMVDLES
jgi:hypothetical protein